MPYCLNLINNESCNESCQSCPAGSSLKDGNAVVEERVRTYNAEFTTIWGYIPGQHLVSEECNQQCRTIHGNAIRVAKFIENKLESKQELSLYISSINIVEQTGYREYRNAFFLDKKRQFLFGQRKIENSFNHPLLSYGTDITIVAHEFCHGLIYQARGCSLPEDKFQERAVEESLCDIFAILVRNFQPDQKTWPDLNFQPDQKTWPDLRDWEWCVGKDFTDVGQWARCLDTMMSLGEKIDRNIDQNSKDYHTTSLIHSRAFYRFMTSKHKGSYLFDGEFALKLFREVLGKLRIDTNFLESRRTIIESAKNLITFDHLRKLKLRAINKAFREVGIREP